MRQFQLLTYPHTAFWAIFMSNLPYNFFGKHDCQTLFVSVEVSNPDGNFGILGKSFLSMLWISESKFLFLNYKDLDFTCLVDFFSKLWSKKIFFMETLSKLHLKKGFAVFPSPAGMSLTKLFLDGNMFPLLSLHFSLSQAAISQNPFESVSVFFSQAGVSRIFLFSSRELLQDLW